MTADAFIAHSLAAIAVVVALATLLGNVATRLRQPAVIGQLLAGIVLGPSVLGHLPGHLDEHLYPAAIRPALSLVAQIALVMFLFTVGYETDADHLAGRRRAVPVVAVAAFAVPMALGVASAFPLSAHFPNGGHSGASFAFVVFMGVALSITAVPVLARILQERGIARTVAGSVSLMAAGLIDLLGWSALALALIAAGRGGDLSWPLRLAYLAVYVVVMVAVVRPALPRLAARWRITLVVVIVALLSAWVTQTLGLHVIFGALLAGLIAPRPSGGRTGPDLATAPRNTADLLLPVFFALAGLSIDISALRPFDLGVLVLLCLTATAGKMIPAFAAARIGGLSRNDAAQVGILVNTRGLTELIALEAGRQAGLLNGNLYTILVLMALVTTMSTGPLLTLLERRSAKAPGAHPVAGVQGVQGGPV